RHRGFQSARTGASAGARLRAPTKPRPRRPTDGAGAAAHAQGCGQRGSAPLGAGAAASVAGPEAGADDGADEPMVAGATVVGGALAGALAAGADGGALSHDGGRLALDLGPISSALSGVVEDGGAAMLEGIEPKPTPVDGAIVDPRSLRSCAGVTGTLKVG